MDIVAVDLGGTHARFALATIAADGQLRLEPELVVRTAEHASFELAWQAFAAACPKPLPRAAAIAVAAPADAPVIKLTNNPWVIRQAELRERLGIDELLLVNDFAAVAYAVDRLGPDAFTDLCGPAEPLPAEGVVTIVGPGTGLGVALLLRRSGGSVVVPTEGGHIDFAPLDAIEDALLAAMRRRYRRVSVERVVAGAGLAEIHSVLAMLEHRPVTPMPDKELWALALSGTDSLATAALDRFCMSLGSVAGDLALAHGAGGVVVAGGLGLRLADHLPQSGFAGRFVAKGRFEARMAALPVKLVRHPQPGLFGAAAAFAASIRPA